MQLLSSFEQNYSEKNCMWLQQKLLHFSKSKSFTCYLMQSRHDTKPIITSKYTLQKIQMTVIAVRKEFLYVQLDQLNIFSVNISVHLVSNFLEVIAKYSAKIVNSRKLDKSFLFRIFSVCASSVRYAPPVTAHVSWPSKSLCKFMTRASGGCK